MFIDQEWKKEPGIDKQEPNKFINKPVAPLKTPVNTASTTETGRLPEGNGNNNGDFSEFGTTTDIEAEYLTFGHFYQKIKNDFQPNKSTYSLPINVKVDVANYHDVSRKINLDPYIEDFNKDGFAIIKEPLFGTSDFYGAYKELLKNEIPLVLTTDFLIYYNQNNLNQVFKEIEKNVFYDNLWEINKKLFDIALTRYKKRQNDVGIANDPILEGIRMEMAYYAVALNLLKPKSAQINDKPNLVDENKFSMQDAENFSFLMPDYLQNDVYKEVDLIYKSDGEHKSPIFLYFRNYDQFKVPNDYRENAKLNNFYLTLKWLNSVFPLYYRNNDCENCLIDHDDWIINMVAASFIASDVSDNNDIKSKWANIYKFVSFFSGLRKDLTYLHYHESLISVFGEDYSIEEIFSPNNKNREEDLAKLQKNIFEFYFSKLEGGFDRNNKNERPKLGMKMFQDSYWPNDYIFKSLTGDEIKIVNSLIKDEKLITSCASKKYYQTTFRCVGFGMDVINLIHPDVSGLVDKYYLLNTNYENYDQELKKLRNLTNDFDVYTWNNNIYWSTLDIAKSILSYDRLGQPVFINNQSWKNKKDMNTILGSWVSLHLQQDKLVNYFEEKTASSFGVNAVDNSYNFIEPNLELVDELIAKNEMLLKMFFALQITKKTNIISVQLKELNDTLKKIKGIIIKELSNQELDTNDKDFIVDFAKLYFVKERSDKSFTIESERKKITESINGVQFVSLIYKQGEKKIMAIGPIFNYKED